MNKMKVWQIKLMKWVAVVGSVIMVLFSFAGESLPFPIGIASALSVFLIFWAEKRVSLLFGEKRGLESLVDCEDVRLTEEISEREKKLQVQEQKFGSERANKERELRELEEKLGELRAEVVEVDELVLLQSFGLYTPHYSYTTSDEYKNKLDEIRKKQNEMVKSGKAVTGAVQWSVNGSEREGAKMVADMQKLLLRAYNSECDDVVEHVKFSNIEMSEKRMQKSVDTISKLGKLMHISITPQYVKLKNEELHLMHEYRVKKEEEKEAARELRQQQKEEERVAKELQELQQKLEKERMHYENAFARIKEQIEKSGETEELLEKKVELEKHLEKVSEEIKDVDYRQANQRAGYVYVISNIGAFGENVYKIGMTRRLEPMDRVNELGGASVPFPFDVHALIFTDDAPKLETALHNAFSGSRVNFVNQRREFFRVSLDEIKRVVRENYDKTVEFVDYPPAEQYRESLKMH